MLKDILKFHSYSTIVQSFNVVILLKNFLSIKLEIGQCRQYYKRCCRRHTNRSSSKRDRGPVGTGIMADDGSPVAASLGPSGVHRTSSAEGVRLSDKRRMVAAPNHH